MKKTEETRTKFSVLLRMRATLDEQRSEFEKFEAEMRDFCQKRQNEYSAELKKRVQTQFPEWMDFWQDFDDTLWLNGNDGAFMDYIAETLNNEIKDEMDGGFHVAGHRNRGTK